MFLKQLKHSAEVQIMKVLLATDFSEFSDAVLRAAEQTPWPAKTSFAVLNVVAPAVATYGWVLPSPYMEVENESATKLVKEAAARLSAKGLDVTPVVLSGYPKQLIPEYAEEWGADLVMVGPHGASALARFLLGSVARAVLRASRCSVEIVRQTPREPGSPMKILLAIDGSECSEQAAESIAGRAWPHGSVVRVLSVINLPPVGIDAWNTVSVIERLRAERMNVAHVWIERAARKLSAAGLEISTEVLDGNVKATIVDEAKRCGADLVVVGSHGRRGLDRMMLGSVAEVVAMHSHCSVEVIKGDADRRMPTSQVE